MQPVSKQRLGKHIPVEMNMCFRWCPCQRVILKTVGVRVQVWSINQQAIA
jgi:hypothetical protein